MDRPPGPGRHYNERRCRRHVDPHEVPDHSGHAGLVQGPPPVRSKRSVWPNADAELLLAAAVYHDERATAAWGRWTERPRPPSHAADRLMPLVYRNLSRLGVAEARLEPCRPLYRATWLRNQRHARVLRGAVSRMAQAGIATLIVKGAALAPLYYRDLGVRGMGDVDILVPGPAFHAAIALFSAAGWACSYEPLQHFDTRFGYAVELRDGAGGKVDLHCQLLMPSVDRDADAPFWDASVPVTLHGVSSRTLSPTDHLLHVCVHGLEWVDPPCIHWIADAMIILERAGDAVDWDRLLSLAEARGVLAPTTAALTFLAERFDAAVPAATLMRLRRTPIADADRRHHELRSRSRQGRPLLELAHHWRMLSRGTGATSVRDALRHAPAYLRFWTRGPLHRVPVALTVRAALLAGHHLRVYRYPPA